MNSIEIHSLQFQYPNSTFQLSIDELKIETASRVAIVGPSGSGKTTLLNLMSGISSPETGKIRLGDTQVDQLNESQSRSFRISQIGMVFQQFELIEYLNVQQNILLPFLINPSLSLNKETRDRASELANTMGLGDKLNRYANQLSQGEKQRVAVCRSLLNHPKFLFADEPTGNLDPSNKQRLIDLLFEQSQIEDSTLLVVTHDRSILKGFDRIIDFETLLRENVSSEQTVGNPNINSGLTKVLSDSNSSEKEN